MTWLTLQVRFYFIYYTQPLTCCTRSKKRLPRAGKSTSSSQPLTVEREAVSQGAGQGQHGSKRNYWQFSYWIQWEGEGKSIMNTEKERSCRNAGQKKKWTSRKVWRCKVCRRKAVNAGFQRKWKGQKEMEEMSGKNRINFSAITSHPS